MTSNRGSGDRLVTSPATSNRLGRQKMPEDSLLFCAKNHETVTFD
jgi:hypothetical protein